MKILLVETYGRPPRPPPPPTTTTVPPFTLSADDMSKYGINDKNCGLKGFTPETIDILYNNTKCFHNSYSPLSEMDMNGPHLWPKQDLTTSRIMGGVGKAKLGEAPWVVYIISYGYEWERGSVSGGVPPWKKYSIECSGVLVAKLWILTAAECFRPQGTWNWFSRHFIRFGNNKEIGQGIMGQVKCTVNYTYYGVGRTDGVALCRLHQDFNIQIEGSGHMLVNTVCLPESRRVLTRTELATMYGFGETDSYKATDNWLRKGVIKLQPSSACPDPYPENLCSDYKRDNISTPCYGDLGAGVVQYTDKYETRAILVATHVNRSKFADRTCHDQYMETYGRPPLPSPPPTTTTVPPFTLSAADMSKYGINDKNCGLRGFTPETIDILYNNTKCFHNSYSPQTVMDMNGPHLWRKQHLMTSRLMGRMAKAKLGEAPWVVSIISTGWKYNLPIIVPVTKISIECSGVLVTKRWVLTAAECLIPQGESFQKTFIRFGNNKAELVGIVNEVKCEVNYTQYGGGRSDGLALCRLEPYVNIEIEGQLMSINTVCLPESGRVLTHTELATMYGFGVYDLQKGTDNWLRKGVLKLQPSSACPDPYPEKLCSDYKRDNTSTPCYGDLGAGVVQYTDKYETRAILVATHANRGQFADKACHSQYSYYISTAYIMDWILQTISTKS
ncbi:unnamed protein product [Medioppia subpectinata]|uniref:Peptidase S1 domain-containing protein n=1 Tax=Medioppia subpectinata TaxID=1979941 RepID=A0A7R9KPM8_9ACAR|nr:unnamed protein product [Medioppia subpectinata]CAG2107502.1 unnamed protein product [Medioppia subpectinata]